MKPTAVARRNGLKNSFISVIQSAPNAAVADRRRDAFSTKKQRQQQRQVSKQQCGSGTTTLVTTDHRWGRYFQRGDRNNRRRRQQGHIAAAASPWHTYNKTAVVVVGSRRSNVDSSDTARYRPAAGSNYKSSHAPGTCAQHCIYRHCGSLFSPGL